jgi:hypothetical protein
LRGTSQESFEGDEHGRFDGWDGEGNHASRRWLCSGRDIDPQELGKTDVDEHLLMRPPLLRVARGRR